jgi:hypothetical protein
MSTSKLSVRAVEANRRNAMKSTGPRSAEGKCVASRNAIKHGLFAEMLLSGEGAEVFEAFTELMLRRLNPRDILEMQVAERIISVAWRLKRTATAENLLYRARETKLRLEQVERESAEIERELPAAAVMVRMIQEDHDPALERMHRYERRLESTLHRCLRQLRQLREEESDQSESEFVRMLLESGKTKPPGHFKNAIDGEGLASLTS